MPVTALLDELRLAFLERRCKVDRFLQPGLARDEIRDKIRPLGFTPSETLVELYAWRNGQSTDADVAAGALRFRDDVFIDLDSALREYAVIQEYFSPEPDALPIGFDLRQAFPFAAFMGSWHVVVCGRHSLASAFPDPVVNVFQGITPFFHSIETMLRTCVDWVRHPAWTVESGLGLSEDVELEIWRRHNPGIFER